MGQRQKKPPLCELIYIYLIYILRLPIKAEGVSPAFQQHVRVAHTYPWVLLLALFASQVTKIQFL